MENQIESLKFELGARNRFNIKDSCEIGVQNSVQNFDKSTQTEVEVLTAPRGVNINDEDLNSFENPSKNNLNSFEEDNSDLSFEKRLKNKTEPKKISFIAAINAKFDLPIKDTYPKELNSLFTKLCNKKYI